MGYAFAFFLFDAFIVAALESLNIESVVTPAQSLTVCGDISANRPSGK